jgi:hypothetical protein
MAKCDEGYPCEVCGGDVAGIWESDLYLRYVIGEVDPEQLHVAKERHLRCNPVLSQFIVDDEFAPVLFDGPFDKRTLDAAFVRERETLVTRGWRRLQELRAAGELSMLDYPLPEVLERMKQVFGSAAK